MLTSPFKDTVERSAFGVCSFLGERMKISSGTVRKYFIYTSFITMGSPVIIYLVMAFWVNIRRYIRKHSKSLWD
jgi:phage shock protein C